MSPDNSKRFSTLVTFTHPHPHSCTNSRAAMHGFDLLITTFLRSVVHTSRGHIRKNLGFSTFPKDSSTCSRSRGWNRRSRISWQPALLPEPQPLLHSCREEQKMCKTLKAIQLTNLNVSPWHNVGISIIKDVDKVEKTTPCFVGSSSCF